MNSTESAGLDVADLVKSYGTEKAPVRVVDGVSFQVEPGHFYSLLGPSGCGKTTTLRCVAGLERTDGGTITIGPDLVAGPGVHLTPDGGTSAWCSRTMRSGRI